MNKTFSNTNGKFFFSRKTVVLLFFSSIFFLQNLANAQSNSEEKVKLTEKQLDQVSSEISKLQKELGKDRSFQKKEQENLKKIELELSGLYQKSRELKNQKKEIQKKITLLKNEEQALDKKNRQQKEALKKDLQVIYKLGKQEKLKLLLNQENPEDIARLLKYYDYYSEARVQRIIEYQENIDAITRKRTDIEEQLQALEEVDNKIEKETLALKENQKEREKLLEKLNRQIKNKDQELNTLRQDQNRLSKLLKSLKGIWADIPNKLSKSAFKSRKGKLPYPVKGKVKHSFGSKRVGGRLKWNGWLIDSRMEEPVRAIHDGRVVFADWIRGYGLLIIVDHSEGYLSLYGHNSSLMKETGDWIQEGEVLATAGNSGGQHEPGLYFELRKDTEPLNPKSWLKR